MNVILLEHMGNLGNLGEEVTVRSGYARNFLIPKGKAVRSSAAARETFEARRGELEAAAAERTRAAEDRADHVRGAAITIAARVGEEGRLYGSVGTREIAEALTAQGKEVDKSEIVMSEGAIRVTGEYEVDVRFDSEVTITVTVTVIEQ